MLSAPHLKRNRWGAALKYYCRIKNVLVQPHDLHGRSAYQQLTNREPDLRRMFFRVFGAPVQYKPLTSPDCVLSPRTLDGYFLGLDGTSVLVDDLETSMITKRISRKHLRVHEKQYCSKPRSGSALLHELKNLTYLEDSVESDVSEDEDEDYDARKPLYAPMASAPMYNHPPVPLPPTNTPTCRPHPPQNLEHKGGKAGPWPSHRFSAA